MILKNLIFQMINFVYSFCLSLFLCHFVALSISFCLTSCLYISLPVSIPLFLSVSLFPVIQGYMGECGVRGGYAEIGRTSKIGHKHLF